ncbi:MAG TPA: hypothetical protein VGN88_02330 [Phycisphaerae bacterium]|jgi:hypothetical protein
MTIRRKLSSTIALIGIATLGMPTFAGVSIPTVILTTTVDQPALHPGDMTNVTVNATVTNGTVSDGITEFDIDVFPLDKLGVHFVGLASIDPAATIVSPGTVDPITGGILGITGIYDPVGKGIGTTEALFKILLQADAIGTNSVSSGLSVSPNGTGVPFQLNISGDYVDPSSGNPITFNVDTSGAVAHVTVTSVPEPTSGWILASLVGAAALLTRRRPQHALQRI